MLCISSCVRKPFKPQKNKEKRSLGSILKFVAQDKRKSSTQYHPTFVTMTKPSSDPAPSPFHLNGLRPLRRRTNDGCPVDLYEVLTEALQVSDRLRALLPALEEPYLHPPSTADNSSSSLDESSSSSDPDLPPFSGDPSAGPGNRRQSQQ